MNSSGNTVLITGGATGIGLALAEAFIGAGSEVIICGRRQDRLDEARARLPSLHAYRCDITGEAERQLLFERLTESFPRLNILVNNAGIQHFEDFKTGDYDPDDILDQINTNLAAPILLGGLFLPQLLKQERAAIINVSSGLGFVPIAAMSVYCATKAALHNFTVSLRHQLKDTGVAVFEIIPPMVATELGGAGEAQRGIAPAELAREVLEGIDRDNYEIAVGEASGLVKGACINFDQVFQQLNSWG